MYRNIIQSRSLCQRMSASNGLVLYPSSHVYATSTPHISYPHILPLNGLLSSTPHPLSLPLNLTACPYFCSFVISPSPCLTTSAYCLFLSSGLLVSIILLTRSMVQGMRSAAMNLARSLRMDDRISSRSRKRRTKEEVRAWGQKR